MMLRTDRLNRKLNICYLITAVVMSIVLCVMQTGTLYVKATSKEIPYPAGYGAASKSQDLYLWHLVDGDEKQTLDSYLSHYEKDTPYRVLLTYLDSSGGYYVEVNWTNIRVQTAQDDVSGAYLKMVSTHENPEIRIGEKEFITRGALRSFFVKTLGKWDHGGWSDRYKYKFFAPNEADNGIEKIAGQELTLTFTSDELGVIEWYFYDGNGKPCGNADDDDAWGKEYAQKSYFEKNASDSDVRYFDEWAMGDEYKGWGNVPCKFFSCQNNTGDDPSFAHTMDVGNSYGDFTDMQDHCFVACELYTTLGNMGEMFTVYVGEKVGTLDGQINQPSLSVSESYIIDKPYFISAEQVFTVKKGGILFVRSLLILEGKIVNNGTIIVADGGAIKGNLGIKLLTDSKTKDKYSNLGFIDNVGGDLILKKGSVVSVSNMTFRTDNKQSPQYGDAQLRLGGRLFVDNNLSLQECQVDFKSISYSGYYLDYFKNQVIQRAIPWILLSKDGNGGWKTNYATAKERDRVTTAKFSASDDAEFISY